MKTIVTMALAAGMACAATAGMAQDELKGRTLFQLHCAVCHGADAKGDGRLAPALQVPPPDLTQLANESDGMFPTDYVLRRIDGSERLLSHGDPMPVYTILLDGPSMVIDTSDGAELAAPEALVDLVAYLQSIQES